ncbi:unnamed protein product [Rhodiola kirilowii]
MKLNISSCSYGDEDDFIDMEISSVTSPRFRYSAAGSSPMQSREFEFQMVNVTHEKEATTCPADELFYQGKLLPLHLPPRIQMVEKLIQSTSISLNGSKGVLLEDQHFPRNNPLFGSATAPCTNSNTPLESCNISPSESCRASSELHPDEYFFDWSNEISSLIARDNTHPHGYQQHCHHLHPKKSWSRKIKHSLLGKKLKASRAYLKSIFNKSVCANESCGKATCNAEELESAGCVLKAKECVNKYIKVTKNKPFGSLQHEKFNISALLLKNSKEMGDDGQRKSFSGAINWNNAAATTKCSSTSTSSCSSSSSSSFSYNFNGFYELQLLKRSSSANMELDSSVEGAIAHCKQSHKVLT